MEIGKAIKHKKFNSSEQKVIVNLVFTSSWVNDMHDGVFKPFDLSMSQFNVLRILRGKYPLSVSPSEIKEVMLDKSPDVTRLCDRLQKKKLISRVQDSLNRRKMLVTITNQGLELLEKVDPAVEGTYFKVRERLSEEELETLSDLLDKLRG